MITPYSNASQTRWDHGEFQVQINAANTSRPIGFCDGTEADLAELRAIAESENAENLAIHKKTLKSGREIWTLGSPAQTG